MIRDNNLSVTTITETWFSSLDPPAIIHDVIPNGYSGLHYFRTPSRPGKRGGGVSNIYDERYQLKQYKTSTKIDTFESLVFIMKDNLSSLTITHIYRPPGPLSTQFMNQFSDLLAELFLDIGHEVVLLGDLHAPGRQPGTINSALDDIQTSFNLLLLINEPTRGENGLDILATSSSRAVNSAVSSSNELSDHNFIKYQITSSDNSTLNSLHSTVFRNFKFLTILRLRIIYLVQSYYLTYMYCIYLC